MVEENQGFIKFYKMTSSSAMQKGMQYLFEGARSRRTNAVYLSIWRSAIIEKTPPRGEFEMAGLKRMAFPSLI